MSNITNLLARVYDKSIEELPKDLYIDPDALLVFLEMFEGPLDLLLYLIRKQNLDILNIPIAQITSQYIAYIEAMTIINIDLAAEYLAMAAALISIKSRLMLPKVASNTDELTEDIDPQVELINRLLEYEKIKQASNLLNKLPTENRDFKWSNVEIISQTIQPKIFTDELQEIWQGLLLKALTNNPIHQIKKQELSVREHMTNILRSLADNHTATFTSLLNNNFNLSVMVVSFIAILELSKEGFVKLEPQKNDIIISFSIMRGRSCD